MKKNIRDLGEFEQNLWLTAYMEVIKQSYSNVIKGGQHMSELLYAAKTLADQAILDSRE